MAKELYLEEVEKLSDSTQNILEGTSTMINKLLVFIAIKATEVEEGKLNSNLHKFVEKTMPIIIKSFQDQVDKSLDEMQKIIMDVVSPKGGWNDNL